VVASARLGPADTASRRALLARWSPEGEAIIAAVQALPARFELPEGPYTVGGDEDLDRYFRDAWIENVAGYATTAVHEYTHAYAGRMAFAVLQERRLPLGDGALALPLGDAPLLVRFAPTFPSRELDADFPADARGVRYAAYIGAASPGLTTQQHGVYGLLDEWFASYTGARTTVALWPWVRDVAPPDAATVINYAVALDDVRGAYADFGLAVLHYLRHAQAHRPEVYAAVLASEGFREAWRRTEEAFAAVLAEVAALEPEVRALARLRGVALEHRDGVLHVDGAPQRGDAARAWNAALAHLQSAPYRQVADALR
jgi:hypothetical protein